MSEVDANKQLAIAYITVGSPGVSGGEQFLVPEINALVERGHHVTVVPRERLPTISPNAPSELAAHVKFVGLASPEVLWELVKLLARDLALVRRLFCELWLDTTPKNRLKNVRVLAKGVWLGRFARAHSLDHIHAHWGATTATLAEIAHLVSGIPWSVTLHRGDIVQNNRLEKKLQSASFVRFISASGVALYERVTGNDPMSVTTSVVVHMGVRLPPEDEIRHMRRNPPFRVICPANLIPLKGHIFLLEAIELLKRAGMDIHLSLAGHGALRSKLERWVLDHRLADCVTFLGQQTQRFLLEAYRTQKFDAVVLPSIDLGNGEHEGIPVSLMEAMAFGLPVVSTATGGIPELLHDGAGVLVEQQDSEALASAIRTLASDHEFAFETARRGRARVASEFDVGEISEKLCRLFASSVVGDS